MEPISGNTAGGGVLDYIGGPLRVAQHNTRRIRCSCGEAYSIVTMDPAKLEGGAFPEQPGFWGAPFCDHQFWRSIFSEPICALPGTRLCMVGLSSLGGSTAPGLATLVSISRCASTEGAYYYVGARRSFPWRIPGTS